MAITKLSDVSDVLSQARQNPCQSFPKILKLARSDDWKEREVAASILVEASKKKPDEIVAEMILWADHANPNIRRTASEGLRDAARKNPALDVRGAWRVGKVISQLDMQATEPPAEHVALVNEVARKAGLSVGLVMSDYPLSFVWGFRHSKLILSSGLLRTLTAAELRGVLEHEAAHHARRDNLIKLFLSVFSYSSLAFPLSRLIVGWRATEVEMVCDGVAAARTSEPLEIAEALVKLRRQTMVGGIASDLAATQAVASSFVSNSSLTFQRRVSRLLTLVDGPVAASTQSYGTWTGAFLLASGLITLSAMLLFAPLSVHHATEALIGIFK